MDLAGLACEAGSCQACPLWESRTNVVFGVGPEDARVMIVGEAPGKNEDLEGRPFVGAAGKNLDSLLGIAGLARDEVYIANVLKCRPPGNRDPRVEEIQACAHFLHDQAKLIEPEVIVTLGNFAARHIMKTDMGITRLRGQVHQVGRFKVLPVYHPAAALYAPSKQEALEADFRTLGALLAAS